MTCNVLHISLRADLGGGPKHLLDLLLNSRTSTKFYTAIPHGHFYSQDIKDNSQKSLNIPHRRFSLIALVKLILFCKKYHIKVVHSHGRGAGYYSRMMFLIGYKVVHTLHGVHIEQTLTNKLKFYLDKLLVPLTHRFICVSHSEQTEALNRGVINNDKTVVIFNGVSIPTLCTYVKSDNIKIAVLGRTTYQKGYDILIDYIEQYVDKHRDAEFQIDIAGDGENLKSLQLQLEATSFAKKRIHFIGKTTDPIQFLSEHSHFLSFARFEGLPISVLESISCGLPCMVSNVTGNKDIINKETGILFQLFSYDSFEASFTHFLNDSLLAYRESAYRKLKIEFDIHKQVDKTIKVYSDFFLIN